MKKNIVKILCVIMCMILTACGGPAPEKVSLITTKYEELNNLYDATAPTVALLEDASVKIYEDAGKTIRKAGRAINGSFDGYNNDDMDELIIAMDNALLTLKSFEGMEPKKLEKEASDGKNFPINILNKTGIELSEIRLKSSSGKYDKTVEPGIQQNNVTVVVKCAESESYTVTAKDKEGNEMAFSGNFYISAITDVKLIKDEEVLKIESYNIENGVTEEKTENPQSSDDKSEE